MSRFKELLRLHPAWIAPRGDQHTVIGVPQSSDHRKTFVEPGGSFSPGVATFGISIWLYDRQTERLYAPEEMALSDLAWSWEEGYLPVLNCSWQAGTIRVEQRLFATALSNRENIVNSLQVVLTALGSTEASYACYLVIRPFGAAGGPINTLAAPDRRALEVNGRVVMLAQEEAAQFGALSYEDDQEDISVFLKQGELPEHQRVEDRGGFCTGALVYRATLSPGSRRELSYDFFVHPLEEGYLSALRAYHQQTYKEKLARVLRDWQERLGAVQLQVPDARFRHAYYALQAQFLMAMVGPEVRIATLTYPLFWLRDGVYIIQALDKAGFHAEMREQLELLRSRIFAGGFGAEPDAFGEGIWAFFTHFQMTHDLAWLEQVYPDIRARGEWIIKTLHTTSYLYADVEMRVPQNRFVASTDLICEPARAGLIQGRMDWHRPLIWINAFSYLGLRALAQMAEALGQGTDSQRYQQEAETLHQALDAYAQAEFGKNERDFVCALWPTGAFSRADEWLVSRYQSWWHEVRLQGQNVYTPEPLWKYFELGQAHNYLLLGQSDKAQQTVEYYLAHHDTQGLYGWLEDDHDIAEFWDAIEGWYDQPSRQPHGWVASEFWLLLRDMLFYEEHDELVLGAGILPAWMEHETPLDLRGAPSAFGPLDVCVTRQPDHAFHVLIRFHQLDHLPRRLRLCLPWGEAAGRANDPERVISVPLERYEKTGYAEITVS